MELYNKAVSLINNSLGLKVLKKLKLLLEIPLAKNQFDINYPGDIMANTLLHFAAACGDVVVIEYLLKHKASLLLKNNDGLHPLQLAIINQHFFATEYLLQHIKSFTNHASIQNSLINESLHVLFVEYAQAQSDAKKYTKDISLLKLLIKFGADVNLIVQLPYKTRLIHIAARFDNQDAIITNTLIEAGADVDACDYKGNSPLHIAAKNFLYSHVATLLPKANISLQNKLGNTALHCLIKSLIEIQPLEINMALLGQFYVKQLIDAGASLTLLNQEKKTALKLYQEYERKLIASRNKLCFLVNYFKQLFVQKAHLELTMDNNKLFSTDKTITLTNNIFDASDYDSQKTHHEVKKINPVLLKNLILKQNRYQFFQVNMSTIKSLIKKVDNNINLDFSSIGLSSPQVANF